MEGRNVSVKPSCDDLEAASAAFEQDLRRMALLLLKLDSRVVSRASLRWAARCATSRRLLVPIAPAMTLRSQSQCTCNIVACICMYVCMYRFYYVNMKLVGYALPTIVSFKPL